MREVKKNLTRLTSAFVVFLSITICYSQHEVRFEKITVDDGLSQSAVTSIIQDKYGYLWIGTLDGLNRYDGRAFKVYRKSEGDSNSLYKSNIHRLFLDSRQNLWLSSSGAISRYIPETDKFTNYPIRLQVEKDVNFLAHDFDPISDSVVLLSTNHGIIEHNTVTGAFRRNKRFADFDQQNISSFFSHPDLGTWVVSRKAVYVLFPGAQEWVKLLEHGRDISSLYHEATQEVYVQTIEHLYKFDPGQRKLMVIAEFPVLEDVDENYQRLLKLSNGELWVVRKAVHIFDKHDKPSKTLTHVPQNPFSISDYLSCLYESQDGVVWVGTNGLGLNKYNPLLSVFNYFGAFTGAPITLSDNYIRAVFTDDDVRLYVSTLEGLDIIDLQQNRSQHFPLLTGDKQKANINKIFRDQRGRLWLATSMGLMKISGNKIVRAGIKMLDDPDLIIFDAALVRSDEILLATGKGLMLWHTDSEAVSYISTKGTMISSLIDQTYWTEFEAQIRLIRATDHQPEKTFENDPADTTSFPHARIKCFYHDTAGNVWIGSLGGGLSLYEPATQSFIHFTERHGLPNAVVYGILEDKDGNLWLSTNKGICVFDKTKKRSVRNFLKSDGLQGNEFNTGAFYKSPSGKMYFGGTNGLTAFRPEEALGISSPMPKSIVTGFFINNNRVDYLNNGDAASHITNNQKIGLTWDQRNFGFEIAGLGFTFPSRTQYMYMLENFDRAWNYMGDERRITFTNIPPGEYILRVKASNSFGDWEKAGLAIIITVEAPFWKTPWFIALSVLVVAGMIAGIYYQRTAQLKRRAHHLAILVDKRTREIQKQQEEIAAQNEEILAQNEELISQSESIDNRNMELEQIKATLEERVEQRTQDLKKLNEELIDQNIQLEQFSFITAHNIRGPVARIKGLINLLPRDNKHDILDHLNTSINNLDEVISDLNTVLNIRQGLNKSFEPISLNTQLMLTLQILYDDIIKVNAEIDTSGFTDVVIQGLRPYLHSIFYNLIHNALKYANTNRKTIIKCSTVRRENNVIITIEDNGVGIDMQYAREKIFKLYQRFHPETRGKGFGLFLVKTQVEALHGRISVDSVINQGTVFTIEFPLK